MTDNDNDLPKLKEFSYKDGVFECTFEEGTEIVRRIAEAMAAMFDGGGATNYVEAHASVGTREYTLTLQKRVQPTPHQLRVAAEKRADEAVKERDEARAESKVMADALATAQAKIVRDAITLDGLRSEVESSRVAIQHSLDSRKAAEARVKELEAEVKRLHVSLVMAEASDERKELRGCVVALTQRAEKAEAELAKSRTSHLDAFDRAALEVLARAELKTRDEALRLCMDALSFAEGFAGDIREWAGQYDRLEFEDGSVSVQERANEVAADTGKALRAARDLVK